MHKCSVYCCSLQQMSSIVYRPSDSGVGGWDLFWLYASKELTSCVRFQIVNALSVQLAI